jgi:hypothetical protein
VSVFGPPAGRRVENKLADAILSARLLPGDTAAVDFDEDGWRLETRRAAQPEEAVAAK